MIDSDLIPVLLLIPFCVALVSGVVIVLLILRWRQKKPFLFPSPNKSRRFGTSESYPTPIPFLNRPLSWMAVRSRDLRLVQSALGLSNPRPCTLTQALAHEQKLFIAPPVSGWILITGSGLPDPNDDVDACFRFQLRLSRRLGTVQFFHANPVLDHHAWVWMESGRVIRAYAWAGRTLWNQGMKTRAEDDLEMKCFQYFESADQMISAPFEAVSNNTDKVPLLAARWSLDPAMIDEETVEHACGIAGELSRLY